jgi:hypothetical protein
MAGAEGFAHIDYIGFFLPDTIKNTINFGFDFDPNISEGQISGVVALIGDDDLFQRRYSAAK